MSRLPTPGGDSGTWGAILNDYLAQAHEADGALKAIPQSKVTNLESNFAALPSQYISRSEMAVIVTGFTDTAIQQAITASGWPANPARIILPIGTYIFTTGVTINGGGATSTPVLVFEGSGALLRTTTTSCVMFTITNSVISITRINFFGLSFHVNATNAVGASLNNAELCRFDNCTFTGNFATGLRFTGTSTYNQISGCHFGDLSRGIYLVSGQADYLNISGCSFNEKVSGNPLNWIQQDVTASASRGIRIVGNTFYGSQCTLPQVRLMHSNNAMISNNTFNDSPAGAVYIGAGGTSDGNSVIGNAFSAGGNADDVYLHGSNRCIISNNLFLPPAVGVTANTYANIRIRDPFTSAQGSGCSVMGNASRATAAAISYVVHADATCTNLAIIGNVGLGDFLAAHVSNQLLGNIAA